MAKFEKINYISRNIAMDILMAENPQTVSILLKYKMHCVGCLLAPFHSVADAAMEHDINEDDLIAALQNVSTFKIE